MAKVESISFSPHQHSLVDGEIAWRPLQHGAIDHLPQVVWEDGSGWSEANQWFHERASTKEVSVRTVRNDAEATVAYMSWLERAQVRWWHFPPLKAERCLVRYRGFLVAQRDNGRIAASTASHRMRTVVSLYRWLHEAKLLCPEWPMWRERDIRIAPFNHAGFVRTISVQTTNLAIPNRRRPGERLEDGLLPVSSADRDGILAFARENASVELFWMLTLGFFTGMRLGTLTDLRIGSLTGAVPEPGVPGLLRIAVGPSAEPAVATKFGISGHIWMLETHRDALLKYVCSTRRLKREIKAAPEQKDLVFLTRSGGRYSERNRQKSSLINAEMSALRRKAGPNVPRALKTFYFHQTRCTFATELAATLLSKGNAINAVAIIKEALLHKDEATSLRYIRFVEKVQLKVDMANSFSRAFLGISIGIADVNG